MKKSTQILISASVGIVFMLVILILAVIFPCPTTSQYNIFRIIISIAVGAFASIIPGIFEFKYSGLVSTTGALAVFAFVFVYDPAKLVVSDECSSDLSLSGIIYINNKEAKNVDIRVSQLKKSDVTDEYGTFKIDYPKKENGETFNFRVTYNTLLDTSFQVTNTDWNNLKFYFQTNKDIIVFNPKSLSDKTPEIKAATHTPKREIKNYFEGNLYESSTVYYGGSPYCKFSMKDADVKIQIKLSPDRKSVESAKVSFKAIEKTIDGCPYQSVPPNKHIYDLENAQITGQNIFISFVGDHSNNPQCSLSLSGTIENEKIIATIYNDRTDMPEPKLVYKIKMDVQLILIE